MASPNTIPPEKLVRLIGTAACPVLVDVRDRSDLLADPRLVPGSRPRPWEAVSEWAGALRGRSVVVICRDGQQHSHGVAAWLRSAGVDAEVLDGGISDWSAAERPMVPLDKLRNRDPQGRTVWVTRSRPKVDRIACPWLIRRFVDPGAVFLFVTATEVADVADRFGATPFDIDGVFWSHRGERCSFDTMIEEFGLASLALDQLATIVRAADTARLDLAPQAAGFLAASLGLSRMFRDDLEQLEAGMLIYDAFYRWCRDATDETHSWPSGPKQL